MKKVILFALFILSTITVQSQLKIGPNLAVPLGDNSSLYTIGVGADAYYMLKDEIPLFDFGIGLGFMNYFGDEQKVENEIIPVDNFQIIPLTAAARISFLDIIYFGPDIGYSFILNEESTGEFFFRGVAGIEVAKTVKLNGFYSALSKDSTFASLGLGILFVF